MEYPLVYLNGEFRSYDDARVGLFTHGLNYGTGCFEGIRSYWNAEERELYLLHLQAHYTRLHESARILMMQLPHTVDELSAITVELCARNRITQNAYLRPLLFKGEEDIGVRLVGAADSFAIAAMPFHAYYDATAGLRTMVSSWRRSEDTSVPARGKITGSYVNSALAKSEAKLNGFDEAIMLSHDGHVSEGSAENIFMVRRGRIFTPDPSQNILEGVTRQSIIEMASAAKFEVIERQIDRSELYTADEIFFTGTAVGVTFVRSVDHRTIGDGAIGPVTKLLADAYERAVYGREATYKSWLTPTYSSRSTVAA